MIALIGLGNPGTKHKNNRHNVGYLFIDQLLQDHDDVMREKKFDGELASFLIGKKKIYTFKSNDYMNECGKSIATFLNFFKIKSNLTYVIHDDLDITLGKIKIKLGGSSAGHNGLKSIDSKIGKNYNVGSGIRVKNIEIIKKDTFEPKNNFFSARRSLKNNFDDYGLSLIHI